MRVPQPLTKHRFNRDIYSTEIFQPSIVSSLYVNEISVSDGDPVVHFSNDVTLLFNQKRLDSLGPDTLRKYIDSLSPKSSGLSELRSRMSDDDLLKLVKSRHIQSLSELAAWSDYLEAHYEDLVARSQEPDVSSEPAAPEPAAPAAPAASSGTPAN